MDKSITEIFEDIKLQMCRDYCKYEKEALYQLDNEGFCVCEKCPLNRL